MRDLFMASPPGSAQLRRLILRRRARLSSRFDLTPSYQVPVHLRPPGDGGGGSGSSPVNVEAAFRQAVAFALAAAGSRASWRPLT